MGDDPGPLIDNVEGGDRVVEPHRHVVEIHVVGGRRGQGFQAVAQVIAEHAGGAALERRQAR